MGFWDGKKVCVTGGAGFIGSYLTELLVSDGAIVTVADNLSRGSLARLSAVATDIRLVDADLGTAEGALAATQGQDVVLNLAAKVTGIEYNRHHHADMFTANMRIASSVIEAAVANRVDRFLVVSTACIYPHDAGVPTAETEGDRGTPEPTNEGYGWAKRMAERLGRYHSAESGISVAICRPFNAYGPRDHWDEQTSHVIPALIKRVMDGEDPVIVWGSGNQTRAFLHARDAARGMKLIAEKATSADPINIGHDDEVSIRDLAQTIVGIASSGAEIRFDTSKPDGYPRRASDVTRLREVTGWVPDTPLGSGIEEMVAEYQLVRAGSL
ncbi:MAG TPA: NAD-dependent epimerase/dehydratase family protein [Actinomycetota bacterium]|nr:NAD-dependent epimerase/dehydratase family protein [Actinomycetota bacterium]